MEEINGWKKWLYRFAIVIFGLVMGGCEFLTQEHTLENEQIVYDRFYKFSEAMDDIEFIEGTFNSDTEAALVVMRVHSDDVVSSLTRALNDANFMSKEDHWEGIFPKTKNTKAFLRFKTIEDFLIIAWSEMNPNAHRDDVWIKYRDAIERFETSP